MSWRARAAELFVAALGASNYTYAEATESQELVEWIGAHVRALEHLDGVPELVVPEYVPRNIFGIELNRSAVGD